MVIRCSCAGRQQATSEAQHQPMASLQTVIASLGNAGAVANARTCIEQREGEERLVSSLAAKLAPVRTRAEPARRRPQRSEVAA